MLTTYSNKASITNAYPIALVRGFIFDMLERGLTHKEIEQKLYSKYSWRGNVKDIILQIKGEKQQNNGNLEENKGENEEKQEDNYDNKMVEPQEINNK